MHMCALCFKLTCLHFKLENVTYIPRIITENISDLHVCEFCWFAVTNSYSNNYTDKCNELLSIQKHVGLGSSMISYLLQTSMRINMPCAGDQSSMDFLT